MDDGRRRAPRGRGGGRPRWPVAAATVAVLAATSACEFAATGRRCAAGPGLGSASLSGGQLADNQLVLTFDGGPGAGTGAIGDYLYASGVQAAFFVGGALAAKDGAVLAALKDQGHLIGNHTYSEAALDGSADPVTEIRKTDELILPYVTGNMFLLRPAGGGLPPALARRLNDAGLSRYVGPVGWDVGAGTAELTPDDACWAAGLSADDCAGGYLKAIKAAKHGIVQLHAQRLETVDLLKALVPQLSALGMTVLRLDAVPAVGQALTLSGGQVGAVGGAAGCDEY